MRYLVIRSIVQIVGKTWMSNAKSTIEFKLHACDLKGMKDENGEWTRESCERYLRLHKFGDFREVLDFRVEIEDGDRTIPFDWSDPESADTFLECSSDTY